MIIKLAAKPQFLQFDIVCSTIIDYRRTHDLEGAMTGRDMERLLASFGVSRSIFDQATRRLREDGRIPNAGRGGNAPDLTAGMVAMMLLVIAGSDAAARSRLAYARLALLEIVGDAPPRHAARFIAAVEALLSDATAAATVSEIRVAQGNGPSSIIYDDGHVEHFEPIDRPGIPAMTTQGVIWGGLIGEIQIEMSGNRIKIEADAADAEGKQHA